MRRCPMTRTGSARRPTRPTTCTSPTSSQTRRGWNGSCAPSRRTRRFRRRQKRRRRRRRFPLTKISAARVTKKKRTVKRNDGIARHGPSCATAPSSRRGSPPRSRRWRARTPRRRRGKPPKPPTPPRAWRRRSGWRGGRAPLVVEGIDISHLAGANTSASAAVFVDGKAAPERHRRYEIATGAGEGRVAPGDDPAAIRAAWGRESPPPSGRFREERREGPRRRCARADEHARPWRASRPRAHRRRRRAAHRRRARVPRGGRGGEQRAPKRRRRKRRDGKWANGFRFLPSPFLLPVPSPSRSRLWRRAA